MQYQKIITENKPFAAFVIRICFDQFCMSMCGYICANSISLKCLSAGMAALKAFGLQQRCNYKKINVGFKSFKFLSFFFFFLMANSLHSTEIKTHSFISRFLFCFGGGCIPSRLQSFRCPKQCLVTRSWFLFYVLGLTNKAKYVKKTCI